MSASACTIQGRARDLVDRMAANGATFDFRPADGALPSSFTFSLPKGGDRWKVRAAITEAKANPLVWQELVAEIGRRCDGGSQ